jgi:small subunit ribosomal protein S13
MTPQVVRALAQEYRHIVRILGTDIDGALHLANGLTRIKGVGLSFSKAILNAVDLRPDLKIGDLSDTHVQKIEDALQHPDKFALPTWFYNRRKDLETGRDRHLLGPDLSLRVKSDIDYLMRIRSWRGMRHSYGLKVRGQRTRTTGRTGRSVGVRRRRRERV